MWKGSNASNSPRDNGIFYSFNSFRKKFDALSASPHATKQLCVTLEIVDRQDGLVSCVRGLVLS